MINLILFSLTLIGIFANEIPCKKLYSFGNNIQNKALLSPIIIVGQRGLKIHVTDNLYKATIDITNIIKGSFGDGKKNILIAGPFSVTNNLNNFCEFNSNENERIYFLETLSLVNGEYTVLFQPEISNLENLEIINKTICNNCAVIPKLSIKDESMTENTTYLDCTTDSKPPSKIKWLDSTGNDLEVLQLRNGARLNLKSVKNVIKGMYICVGTNILGETRSSIIMKDDIRRCAMKDKEFCNNRGKCYEDKIVEGNMFCRCYPGFLGSHCIDNSTKLSDNYLIRSLNLDKIYCNKNGEGYRNAVTKTLYCLCNDGYYGKRCSKPEFQSRNFKGIMLRNRESEDYKLSPEIRSIMDESSSKIGIKYIIIGATIVLGGCIIILLVIIIVFKCYSKRLKRNVKQKKYENGTNLKIMNAVNDLNMNSSSKTPESDHILSIDQENTHYQRNAKPQIINNVPHFSGEGIYEGNDENVNSLSKNTEAHHLLTIDQENNYGQMNAKPKIINNVPNFSGEGIYEGVDNP